MRRSIFMKASLIFAVLCISFVASAQAVQKRTARVRVVNNSGKDIQASSTFVAHKYSNNYKNQLAFSKNLTNGETDDAAGTMLVEYNTGFLTTGDDWWYVTWVFAADKAIYQTDPQNFRCFLDGLEKVGPKIITTASGFIAGVAACGFPPIAGCSASPLAAAGAAIASEVLSAALLNDEATCGFKQYILRKEDDMNNSADTWVTITIEGNNQLTISAPSGSTTTVYDMIQIRPDGKVIAN